MEEAAAVRGIVVTALGRARDPGIRGLAVEAGPEVGLGTNHETILGIVQGTARKTARDPETILGIGLVPRTEAGVDQERERTMARRSLRLMKMVKKMTVLVAVIPEIRHLPHHNKRMVKCDRPALLLLEMMWMSNKEHLNFLPKAV